MNKYMIKKTVFFAFLLLVAYILVPSIALAANPLNNNPLLNGVADGAGFNTDVNPDTIFTETLGTVVFTIVSFLGILFIILIIYGGYVWMMARGNDSDVDKAKKIIKDAIIGLVVLTASYSIWLLVSNTFLSPNTQ